MEMKKLLVILIILVILASSTAPAFAASAPHRGGLRSSDGQKTDNFTLSGVITAIDSQARTVTVMVLAGSYMVHPYLGQELVVSTHEGTLYYLRTEGGCIPITFEDLESDQNVNISGQKLPEAWQAQRITVGAVLKKMIP
jgi:hypothetical protein